MTNGFRALAGDFVGASDWRAYSTQSGQCDQATFPSASVQAALRGFTGPVRFVVEVSSKAQNNAPLTGCRVRSDYGPTAAAQSVTAIPASCTAARSCGTNSPDPDNDPATDNPTNIFGYVDDTRVELTDNNRRMVIHIPKEDTCGSSFSLLGLEFKLTKSSASGDNAIPTFTSARISAGVSGSNGFSLPDISRTSDADLWVTNDRDDAEDDTGERDLDGSDGSINLRWRDSFCTLTADPNDAPLAKTCTYPLVLGGASELTVELQFAGSLCDVKLMQTNFRVPLAVASDGTVTDELICTARPADPTDQDDAGCGDCNSCQTACNTIDRNICPAPGQNPQESRPNGADPDLPAGCRLEGVGRGPVSNPELACVACTENCAACQCPLNDNDGDIAQDFDPTIILGEDGSGPRNNMVDFQYTQQTGSSCSSADCPFSLRDIEIRIECNYGARDCDNTEVLGKLVSASIVHGSGSSDVLPPPTTQDEGNTAYREYAWRNLTQDIVTSETFRIRLTFDDDISNTNLTRARVTIARPMPFECQANGTPGGSGPPVCNMPSASRPIQ